MKILYVTATYSPTVNGVAVSVKTTAENLRKLGHDVTILAPNHPNRDKNEEHVVRYPSIVNPFVRDYPLPLLSFNADLFKEKFDIVHAHHPFQIAAFAKKYAEKSKAPFVFTYHTRYDYYVGTYLKYVPVQVGKAIIKRTKDFVLHNADLVIAPSKVIKDELLAEYSFANIEVVPTGINISTTATYDKSELRKEFGIPQNKKVLLSLSRLAEEKNIDLLLASTKLLPDDFVLVITGAGPYENVLKQKVNELNIAHKVLFFGILSREDVGKMYEAADIFMFPSITETQGINLLDAMFHKLPVVAVKSGVSEEWVPKNVGILTENTEKDFSRAILNIESLGTGAGLYARTWAEKFSIENTSKMMLNAYETVIVKKNLPNR